MYKHKCKQEKAFSLAMITILWLTVPLIVKKSFFRFLPVANFINLFLSVMSLMANKKKVVEALQIRNHKQPKTCIRWYRNGEVFRLTQPVGQRYTHRKGPHSSRYSINITS
ncbi:hypothetical protein NST66_28105 [Priestia sp. FSL W8-0524]|uniref:hypothetical protein n=1 Tax=Priestia sp. FSL W8-0524 TaxID=2954625 RepID=UPI0030F638A6